MKLWAKFPLLISFSLKGCGSILPLNFEIYFQSWTGNRYLLEVKKASKNMADNNSMISCANSLLFSLVYNIIVLAREEESSQGSSAEFQVIQWFFGLLVRSWSCQNMMSSPWAAFLAKASSSAVYSATSGTSFVTPLGTQAIADIIFQAFFWDGTTCL